MLVLIPHYLTLPSVHKQGLSYRALIYLINCELKIIFFGRVLKYQLPVCFYFLFRDVSHVHMLLIMNDGYVSAHHFFHLNIVKATE